MAAAFEDAIELLATGSLCAAAVAHYFCAFLSTLIFTAFWPILAWLSGQIIALLVRGRVVALAQVAALTMVGF
ncbi:MAG: hypothetical protein HC886_08550 [Leptolyngbyaceae cyanobacterium SM1_1_3]|nr:hypothetical protein [Leptolyngbyaceae cyanobacterium SM1_1_3]NJN01750.1 hypothetical protein [Leptolyngbyaceae cyanobacterium RM1_1_2]